MSSSRVIESFRAHRAPKDAFALTDRAAVLIALQVSGDDDVSVVLTERSTELRKHAGEVALPGGRYEPEDGTLIKTALREAHEEVGLHPDSVLTHLRLFLSKHNLLVTPIIALLKTPFTPTPNPTEVSAVFTVPLNRFIQSQNHTSVDIIWNGYPYRSHAFMFEGWKIWGLTAEILITAAKVAYGADAIEFEQLAPGQPSVNEALEDGGAYAMFRARLQKL
ncbi:hypothetical protein HDV00_002151 [Rhizophlyctis rosea]|nr:hypothetical protein HDV00_002151 [Rhizophlyctis rosea]